MLFNSYVFLFAFLPATLAGFYLLCRYDRRLALAWLVLASLFFYGWWNPAYVGLLLGSMVFNYVLARRLRGRRGLLTFGIAGNLGLLGYYKYCNFFIDNLNAWTGSDYQVAPIVLPLAISFITFQQIAYLVDAWRGNLRDDSPLGYMLFITFFPQLIAGPIVHHHQVLPQFARAPLRWRHDNAAVGLTLFAIGLFKKVVLADGIAPYSDAVFDAAARGESLSLLEAWGGALAYTLQLYFDFSGYADMAIGGARLFGIRLPINFYSPYQAHNIVEFWRRWHITLSHFLRNYLYIPLGGNRKGKARRYLNLIVTMLLGGLWHGAGWTFVIWGLLHGVYLAINHAWQALRQSLGWGGQGGWSGRLAGGALTFVAVVIAWVFFRAESLDAALQVLAGMAGLNGVLLPEHYAERLPGMAAVLQVLGVEFLEPRYFGGPPQVLATLALLAIVWLLPNSAQLMTRYRPVYERISRLYPPALIAVRWRPTAAWAAGTTAIAGAALLSLGGVSEFLYFQF